MWSRELNANVTVQTIMMTTNQRHSVTPTLGQLVTAVALVAVLQLDLFESAEVTMASPREPAIQAPGKRSLAVTPSHHLEYLLPRPVVTDPLEPVRTTLGTITPVITYELTPMQLKLFS